MCLILSVTISDFKLIQLDRKITIKYQATWQNEQVFIMNNLTSNYLEHKKPTSMAAALGKKRDGMNVYLTFEKGRTPTNKMDNLVKAAGSR